MRTIEVNNMRLNYDSTPDICPLCHHAIDPKLLFGSLTGDITDSNTQLEIVYKCTRKKCSRIFIALYDRRDKTFTSGISTSFYFYKSVPVNYKSPEIYPEVSEISPNFKTIFEQAYHAESLGLNEISGVGYRKSIEFLIKDYCIYINPDQKEKIINSFLGKVIDEHVDDVNVQACSKRATWIGNDETHYIKKWENKDINDLKILIELTCGWIKNKVLTEKYMKEME